MVFDTTSIKEGNEKVRIHLAAAADSQNKKRKHRHPTPHADGPDGSFGGYMADVESNNKKTSKKHKKKKKTRKFTSPTALKSIKHDYDDEVDEAPRKKKTRNCTSELIDDKAAVAMEIDSTNKTSPGLKHRRKLSKDEYEDRRRSPATLKLLCLYPSEYTDCESSDERAVLVTDEEDLTDSEMQDILVAKIIKMEDYGQTPIPPPARIFDTIYTRAKTNAVMSVPKHIPISNNTPSQATDTNDSFASAVSQMRTTLFDKVTTPHTATRKNSLQIRTKDWETTSGKIRGSIDLGDDSEVTENIAFSKNYIESTPANTVRFSGSACTRLVIAAGETTNDLSKHTSDAKDVTICLLVKGGPANISLQSNGPHVDPFPMSEGGFWSVRGGGICTIRNKGPDEMIVWAVTQGKPDTDTFMTALGTFGRGMP